MKINPSGKKIVVYGVAEGHPYGKKNLLFDRGVVGEHAQISPYLYEKCLERGIQLVTPDIYFEMGNKPKSAVFVWDSCPDAGMRKLIRAGLHPAVLIVLEGPVYAVKFFYNLERETEPFDYVFMAKGAEPRVSPKTKFRSYIPNSADFTGREQIPSGFGNRKFLALIAGNKRIHRLRRIYATAMNFLNPFPNFVNRELYRDRLEAIRYFSRNADFDLYGHGWDKPVRYENSRYRESVKKSYRGEPAEKLSVLRNYKFSICFENCIFGGYITEKIIDSMFAGCIPVYWGAPDVADYIPESCFIDFRNFKNYRDLETFLKNMDEETYNRYIENIKKFVVSDDYYENFSKEKFAADLVGILASYF